MDPRQLRDLVEAEIKALIDPVLWAERRSIDLHMRPLQLVGPERQAVEIQARHLAIFQSLNSAER
jgi:hypothetical protein